MRYTVRDLVYIGIFGALWGVVEMTFGDLLHALGSIPLRGSITATVGIAIALVGRTFVPKRGATLMTGVIAMLLKMLSPSGQAVISVMIAILAESLLAESGLLIGRERRAGFVLAGALAIGWNLIHPFFSNTLLYGRSLVEVYLSVLQRGADLLGLDPTAAWAVLGASLAIRMGMGAVGGWLAWDLGRQVRRRLGRTASVSASTVER